eukprot:452959-Amphidinium_carterae.1
MNHKGLVCDWPATHMMARSGENPKLDLLPTIRIETTDQTAHQALCDALEEELNRYVIPLSPQRSNARDQQEGTVRSLALGAYCVRGAGVTRVTEKHAKLLELVHRLAGLHPQIGPYLSVSVNQLSSLLPHRDKNNQSYNYIILLGDFTHGELWLGDATLAQEEDAVSAFHRQSGNLVKRKRQWVAFDPRRMHGVLPSAGKRWSIVLYTPKH